MPLITINEALCLIACLNYPSRDAQLDDNMSVAGARDFMKVLNWNAQQIGGLIASLEKKGLGQMDTEGINGEPLDLFWLSDRGINTIFNYLEDADRTARAFLKSLDSNRIAYISDPDREEMGFSALNDLTDAEGIFDDFIERLGILPDFGFTFEESVKYFSLVIERFDRIIKEGQS